MNGQDKMTEYLGIAMTIAQRERLERECEEEGYESLSAFVRERRLFPESTAGETRRRVR
jgi:hypothetical protein